MRRLIAFGLAGLAVLVIAAPALATAPQRTPFSFDDEFVVNPFPGGCTFPVDLHFVGSGTDTLFFDAQGNPRTLQSHVDLFATFTNTTNGENISGPAHYTEWLNPEGTTLTVNGLFHQFTVPGAGVVFLDTGRLVIDLTTGEAIFEAGPHQDFDGDLAGLCAALA